MPNKLTRIGDELGLVIEPALRLDGVLIWDLVGGILVPVIGLNAP